MKDHKFFEKYLDNDLSRLSMELHDRYRLISNLEKKQNDIWLNSNSMSTIKYREYNVFQFNIDGIYNLYKALQDLTRDACQYYDINFNEQKYMIQGWFNINHAGQGKLDWHDHGKPGAPRFHGYYCVNAEPSTTKYKIFNDENNIVDNINKNNRAILSEMGHQHSMNDWTWDGPRITVAYDIIPLSELSLMRSEDEQHWVPLG
jgi:hypothetical protein